MTFCHILIRISSSSIRRVQCKHAKIHLDQHLRWDSWHRENMRTFKKCPNTHKFCLQASYATADKEGTSRGYIPEGPRYRQQSLQTSTPLPILPSSNFPQICLSCITCSLNLLYNTCSNSAASFITSFYFWHSQTYTCQVSSKTAFS